MYRLNMSNKVSGLLFILMEFSVGSLVLLLVEWRSLRVTVSIPPLGGVAGVYGLCLVVDVSFALL